MSLLVCYSFDSIISSHKFSKILSYIYRHNNHSRPSSYLITHSSLNHTQTFLLSPPKSHINYTLNYPNYSIIPIISLIPSRKMATCVHSSRAEQPTKKKNCDQDRYTNYYCRPNFSDLVSCAPVNSKGFMEDTKEEDGDDDDLWSKMVEEARSDVEQEPILSNYYYNSILSHKCLERALANHLAAKLSSTSLNSNTLFDLFLSVLVENKEIVEDVRVDLIAVRERDPACISYVHCFLNFKGFLACESHRIAHKLWSQGRKILALLIQNRVSEVFAVDIHPGAKIGRGILLDHATGVVIGETAVIGNNVSILHNVTLGGTGKTSGDRHPKIGNGVLIGAGTCVLGNVVIADGAKIGAGSVVLKGVPPRTTAVGNPARLIGGKDNPMRLDKIPSLTMDHTSHITEWSDYVI